jgi:DNA-directed RNA polymerase subunit alpha
VDAIFTPVKKVNYFTENMRVGERTDYDRLKVTIITDGSITPKQAFLNANQILLDHFKILCSPEEEKKKTAKKSEDKEATKKKKKTEKKEAKTKESKLEEDINKTKVEDLNLSSRVVSALTSAKIKTVGGLTKKTEEDLQNIEGLGGKGIKEIKRALGRLGLGLK